MSARPTASRLASLSKSYKDATANQGLGGLGAWPDEGQSKEHPCRIKGLTINEEAKFEYGQKPNRKSVDAVSVQFLYECDTPNGVLSFKGNPVVIPFEIEKLPEDVANGKQQTRANIMLERLKGNLQGLLGREPSESLADDLGEAEKLINDALAASTFVNAVVYLEFRDGGYNDKKTGKKIERVEKNDFIREVIAGAAS